MIDENLPIFFFRPSKEKGNFDTAILLAQQGADAAPAYVLRRPDPALAEARNRYAIALCDAYAPDVLYGEILLEPNWTQPSLSMETIRLNGGVAPAPQPILPDEFTVQLYNPDQQIKVRHIPSSWSSMASWEFSMPQESFRRPSASTLDRVGSDPTSRLTTPMISMRWKRMGKLSKDLMCYLTGKSQNVDGSRKKTKEPDIPLSFFHHFSELTIYEPNVTRLDIEDPKGFEVITILAATAIRDVYFNALREAFNIVEIDIRGTPVAGSGQAAAASPTAQLAPAGAFGAPGAGQKPTQSAAAPAPTGAEARRQWQIEAESAQLRYQMEQEERARKQQELQDEQRARRMYEEQQKEQDKEERRKRAEVEKETERLRKEWESERARIRKDGPALPPRKDDRGKRRENGQHGHRSHHHQQQQQQPYLSPEPDAAAGALGSDLARPKSSIGGGLNIFRSSDDKERKMLKKKSAIW